MNLEQVDAALGRARAAGEASITGDGRLAESMTKVENAGQRLGKGMKGAAGAIGGLSSALGENAGAAGKAVAGAGQLANAWAMGGPLMLGIAAVGVGLTMLQKHWDDVIKKQD